MPSSIRNMTLEEINKVLEANGLPKQTKRPFTIPTAVDNLNVAYDAALKYRDIHSIIAKYTERYGAESTYAWLVASNCFGSKFLITMEHLMKIFKELKKQGKL